jgi:hypothetical protein
MNSLQDRANNLEMTSSGHLTNRYWWCLRLRGRYKLFSFSLL